MSKKKKIKKEKAAVEPSELKCKFGGFCYPHKSRGNKQVCSKCEREITPKKIAWQKGEKKRKEKIKRDNKIQHENQQNKNEEDREE